MIDFQIGKKEYTIKELTIRDYYAIEPFLNLSDQKSKYEVISGLSDAQITELKKLKLTDWNLLWSTLERVISLYFSQDIGGIIDEFEFKGVEYGLVKMDKVTVGEFADLDILVNQPDSKTNLHKILAILYRPIIKRGIFRKTVMPYDQIDFEEQAEIFKDLPLKYVKSSLSFFLLLGNHSLVSTLDSLVKEIRKSKDLPVQDKEKLLALLKKPLEVGGGLLISSPEKIQRVMEELQTLVLEKDLTGSVGNTQKSKKQTKQQKTN